MYDYNSVILKRKKKKDRRRDVQVDIKRLWYNSNGDIHNCEYTVRFLKIQESSLDVIFKCSIGHVIHYIIITTVQYRCLVSNRTSARNICD